MTSQSKALISEGGYKVDFDAIPEECIANIIALTTPRDACCFSSISNNFKSAADSNLVWECFLPSDYREIFAQSNADISLLDSLSKKQLFMYLADSSLLLNDSNMNFFLDKSTGKKCYTIGARNLSISWGDTPRYWEWYKNCHYPKSRFPEVAMLHYVWWLEIQGKINTAVLSPNTNYDAYLVFGLTPVADGFINLSIEVIVETISAGKLVTNVFLISDDENDPEKLPKNRKDGWLEVKIGCFLTMEEDEDEDVIMSFMEVVNGTTKSGLIVEGIEIRPSIHG